MGDVARRAAARKGYGYRSVAGANPYGTPVPTPDLNTGLPLLKLPPGFRYLSYGWNGDRMSDGIRTPTAHDGMAVIDIYGGNPDWLVLVRNHEAGAGAPFVGAPGMTYRTDGAGGTTNLIFDKRRGRFLKSWSSIAGTQTNCAGGVTPWNTWLTCEEVQNTGHGWVFDVGVNGGDPRPITGLGKFRHEACMVDPANWYVYQTEDNGTASGLYRFVPNDRVDLRLGGRLQMLRVTNSPGFDFSLGYALGTTWGIDWVDISDSTAATTTVFTQGRTQGGAGFRRLEGCWWGTNTGYFLATDGGGSNNGQVFELDPLANTVKLIFESPNPEALDNPDNMTVTPRGGILLCEDQASSPNVVVTPGNPAGGVGERLVGLNMDGTSFVFAENNVLLPTRYNDRIGPVAIATTSSPARATALATLTGPVASGCSSTSRPRASRSQSQGRGARARSN